MWAQKIKVRYMIFFCIEMKVDVQHSMESELIFFIFMIVFFCNMEHLIKWC